MAYFAVVYLPLRELLLTKNPGAGNLGIFVLVAYMTGNIVQAVGNLLEKLWWRLWHGMPTELGYRTTGDKCSHHADHSPETAETARWAETQQPRDYRRWSGENRAASSGKSTRRSENLAAGLNDWKCLTAATH